MSDHERRRHVREAAAGISTVVAIVYLLIGFSVITVVDDQGGEVVPPMVLAGVVYALLAVLVIGTERQLLWVGGAGLQVLVIVGYLVVAAERTPAFEPWGIGLRVLEVLLLAAFVHLAVTGRTRARTADAESSLSR